MKPALTLATAAVLTLLSGPARAQSPAPPALDTAVFAGGCFWGVEAVFEHVKGVVDVVSGYAGGSDGAPTYQHVSSGTSGHAESVRVTFDPSAVSYATLLRVFFSVAHDATQLDRQGPDVGPQYRSAIFYRTESQERIARAYIAQLTEARYYPRPIVTEVAQLTQFHLAEPYHQDYMAHHPTQPYIVYNDAPKLARLKSVLPELYRERQ
jgi:peptide-methionine (S)-S-oxide reductase